MDAENTLISIFETELNGLKFNSALAAKFRQFQHNFVNRNRDHMTFFGGNLIGVEVVRFTDKDFKHFFEEILHVNRDHLASAILQADAINENFKISSDCFNVTCMYVIHGFLSSPFLGIKEREQAALNVALLFNYRCITAFMSYYFRYPTDRKTAEATYAALSQRFLIKKLGSWNAVMLYRAQSIVEQQSIHRQALESFNDDFAIVYAINDSQGRISDLIKNIYAVFTRIHAAGEQIGTVSSVGLDMDGEEIIRDKVGGLENYSSYLLSVVTDPNSFIKEELVRIVCNVIHTTQKQHVVTTLTWISDAMLGPKHKEVEAVIKTVLVYSYHYLLTHDQVLHDRHDVAGLLTKLRGLFISSRSSDEELLALREQGGVIVTEATNVKNENVVAAIRTGVLLYICLRAFTKTHYTS